MTPRILLKVLAVLLAIPVLAGGAWYYLLVLEIQRDAARVRRSNSVDEARNMEFYVGSYRALDDSLRLRDRPASAVRAAWVEQSWGYDVSLLYRYTAKAGEGYEIVLPLSVCRPDTSAGGNVRDCRPGYRLLLDDRTGRLLNWPRPVCYGEIGFRLSSWVLSDTVAVVAYQKRTPESSWEFDDLVPVDTILWVRDFVWSTKREGT